MQEGFGLAEIILDESGNPWDYRLLEVNDAFGRLTGFEAKAAEGKTARELVPEVEPHWIDIYGRVALTGEAVHFEAESPSLGKWFEIYAFSPEEGRFAHLFIDITERKRAEQAARENERLFQTAVDHFPGVFNIYDADRRLQYVNAEALRVSGLPAEALIGRRDEEVIPETICSQYLPALKGVYEDKEVREFEIHLPEAYGAIFQAVQYVPVLDDQGDIRHVLGITKDITARKQAEAERVRQKSLLQSIFDHIPVCLVLWDPKLHQFTLNRHIETIVGWTTEEANGGDFMSKVYPDPAYRAEVIHYMRSLQSGWREWRMTARNGSQIPVDWANIRLTDGTHIGIGVDLRERKKIEGDLRRLTETLEQQVDERTDLAEARSKQLQSLAVELIEAEERERRRIAELLHDDLQQLLASAKLQLQTVTRDLPENRVLGNVDQLLETAIEQARGLSHELSPSVLHHSGLMPALQWLVRKMEKQFGLAVDLNADPDRDFQHIPLKEFLFRVVQELLFNTYKHSGVTTARVRLSGTGDRILVAVSDDGQGFDPAILQAPTAKSGLGLLSLRERVHSLGGHLDIDSRPGAGSQFTLAVPFDLPVPEASAPPPAEAAHLHPHPDEPSSSAGEKPIRVLFADDHQVMRQGLVSMIEDQPGIQVVGEATNGLEAIDLTRRLQPDVVVMDITMPEMDGIEATHHITREMPDVRVIWLSMFQRGEISDTTMRKAGAETFLSKTASPGELLKAIYGLEPAA